MKFFNLVEEIITIGTRINNWSIDNLFKIPYYTYLGINNNKLMLEHPLTKKIIQIPESSFLLMLNNWDKYCRKEIPRNQLRDIDRYTTYTICVIHFLKAKLHVS